MSTRRPGRPREDERPDRPHDITQAAIRLFGRQGYAGATFAAVAKAADMTPAALYHYFEDKAALYRHAVRVARDRTWRVIDDQLQPLGSPAEDFGQLLTLISNLDDPEVTSGLRLLASAPVVARQHEQLRPLLQERRQIRHSIVGDIGRRAHRRGQLARFADPEDAARAVEIIFSGWVDESYACPELQERLSLVAVEAVRSLAGGDPSADSEEPA